ncbi:homoserine dehydrogenase [Heyndrickxia ginsengihumi]|uniref:Homoserine dehydrogenase n=1 Tax=Heyndrickxia ginsengihumi TaxID=363870 RepID=A0A0A6VB77_9BACI|nr:homoserine dehydrogenase [Heyndrickxia ginsengihumi]KHD85525.1 homoserine dehydrogenase [Heyndrickxia ginsengihumi]MBE6182897.1 homoserine dehydrogenase [Bacillus sp. (in: firmicutes)]MCM3023915.1 homoserine dehydrogenase [Heyndrickxia ginsengihumi]NEY19888.1 homoserine dehydrogenase [Heyndrickxia ginsengihumi]
MKQDLSIGLLGLGTVGTGVVKLIEQHQEELVHQLGCQIKVKKVLIRNVEKDRDVQIDPTSITTNPEDVLNDPDIDVIVEVMGGIDEARQYILEALQNRKHVVTANKDLIALYGPELQEIAWKNQCDLLYEASVGGGIPILRGLTDGLVADRIQKLMGIVNGTTNYILTKMMDEGVSYEEALKTAQELGFAEADPTSDVAGLDAARKMAILARLAFLTDVSLNDVEVEGITNLSSEDLNYGKTLGYTMKLIGMAQCQDERIEVSVQPTFIAKSHPLAAVKDEFNAVYVNGEAIGETMFYGPGAGSLPTATAVVSDVIAAIKNMQLGINGRNLSKPRFKRKLKSLDQRFGQYYIRLHLKDQVGAFSQLTTAFSELDISFKRIIQTPDKRDELAEIIIVTHQVSLDRFQQALLKLNEMPVVKQVNSYYRVEGENK